MKLSRRGFLKAGGLAMVSFGLDPLFLARAAYAQSGPPARSGRVLVCLFQRGAVDGLSMLVPHGDAHYYKERPNIAIPESAAIDLDGRFGLHPALAPLKPLWDKGQLACVHAAGSPDPTRSHFDAQDYMESGTPGRKGTSDGWLNRALAPQKIISPVRAVSLGSALPRALRGRNDAVAVNNLNEFQVRDTRSSASFESMYAGTLDKVLNGTGRETFDAVKLMQSIQKQSYTPANGARYPGGRLGPSLMQIARLIKADVGLEVAFTDMGGWDTHANEVGPKSSQGQLANLLSELGQSMAAFYQDLGDRMADVTIVTMSEFGRTARGNGNRGTDHGHANVMFALGGSIKGGKVYGDWPGLEPEQLYEQRDLNLTTDFRDVLGELVTVHLGNREIKNVFPGYTEPKFRGLVVA